MELYVPHRACNFSNEEWRVLQGAAEPYVHADEEGTHAQEVSSGGQIDHGKCFHCLWPCEGVLGVQRRVYCLAVQQASIEPSGVPLGPAVL